MNLKVTAGFLVVLALLAAVVVGLDRFKVGQSQATAEAAQDEALAIYQFDDRQATAFVARSGDKTVRFEKDGESNWKIAGSEEPPNKTALTSLLIRMSQLRGTKRVGETGGDLKQFGLAEPKVEATAELADGTTYTLQLGDTTPTGTGTYARKADGSDVFVVPTQFPNDVQRLANDPKEPPTPTPRPSPTGTPTPPASPSPAASPQATPTP